MVTVMFELFEGGGSEAVFGCGCGTLDSSSWLWMLRALDWAGFGCGCGGGWLSGWLRDAAYFGCRCGDAGFGCRGIWDWVWQGALWMGIAVGDGSAAGFRCGIELDTLDADAAMWLGPVILDWVWHGRLAG